MLEGGSRDKLAPFQARVMSLSTAQKKVSELGGKVVTLSDSSGFIYDSDGVNEEKLAFLVNLKIHERGRIEVYAEHFNCSFDTGAKPWSVPCDLAFPCATQNELTLEDAKKLTNSGCIAVAEGANMPTTPEAIHWLQKIAACSHPVKPRTLGGSDVRL